MSFQIMAGMISRKMSSRRILGPEDRMTSRMMTRIITG